jgi:hypothetical protein
MGNVNPYRLEPCSYIFIMFSDRNSLWEPFPLPENTLVSRTVGPLGLWFQRKDGECWVAVSRDGAGTPPDEWTRWALRRGDHSLRMSPLLPDRSVVVKPEYDIRLLKNTHVRTYTRVPIWVALDVIGESSVRLTEIPTQILSNTWFGGFTDGETCYGLATTARREMPADLIEPHQAVCIMDIRNQSETDLKVDRVCLRVERLSLFTKDGHLWADDTDITFEGEEASVQIRTDGLAPVEVADAVKLVEPRQPQKRGLAERAFFFLRNDME